MAIVHDQYRYRVSSMLGPHMRATDEAPRWYAGGGEAKDDAKGRLDLRRLRKERRHCREETFKDQCGGRLWRCEWRWDFAAVPRSHPDYGRAGGVIIRKMAPVEQ